MSAQGTYKFHSVQRQTILLVNGEPLARERVKFISELCFITPQKPQWGEVIKVIINNMFK